MKTLNLYHDGATIDRDGELKINVEPSVILENFTAGEILEHFTASDLLELMDDDEVIKYLEALNYSVVDLEN